MEKIKNLIVKRTPITIGKYKENSKDERELDLFNNGKDQELRELGVIVPSYYTKMRDKGFKIYVLILGVGEAYENSAIPNNPVEQFIQEGLNDRLIRNLILRKLEKREIERLHKEENRRFEKYNTHDYFKKIYVKNKHIVKNFKLHFKLPDNPDIKNLNNWTSSIPDNGIFQSRIAYEHYLDWEHYNYPINKFSVEVKHKKEEKKENVYDKIMTGKHNEQEYLF